MENKIISGIYKISNIINNDFYIGSSKNIINRFEEHRKKLIRNKHINIILQRAWNKHGMDNFIFEIVEECDIKFLFEREQIYLNKKPKYNICLNAFGGDNLTNNPKKKEIIEKITNGLYRRYENMTMEEKKHNSDIRLGEKNSNFGNKWTEEMRENARKRSTEYYKNNKHPRTGKKNIEIFGEEKSKEISKKISESASSRIGEKNPFFGKTHSDETKDRLKTIRIGKYYGEQNIPFKIEDKEYDSLGLASKELNIPITTIRWRLKSKNEKFKNYQYLI